MRTGASLLGLLAGVGLLLNQTACQTPAPSDATAGLAPAARHGRSLLHQVVGESVQGRPIECEIHGQGRQVVFILATIHGNESAGTAILQQLGRHLESHPDLLHGRRIILMPLANPDAFHQRTRHNASDVDLNRNFPAGNFAARKRSGTMPLSEPESRAIHHVLETYTPLRVVSIHQPLNCVDYDGPALALAQAVADCGRLPVRRIGSRPGSLGSYVGNDLNTPILTIELPATASRLDAHARWQRYGRMLLAAITWPEPPPGIAR